MFIVAVYSDQSPSRARAATEWLKIIQPRSSCVNTWLDEVAVIPDPRAARSLRFERSTDIIRQARLMRFGQACLTLRPIFTFKKISLNSPNQVLTHAAPLVAPLVAARGAREASKSLKIRNRQLASFAAAGQKRLARTGRIYDLSNWSSGRFPHLDVLFTHNLL